MDERKVKRWILLFLDMLMGFMHVPFFLDRPFSMNSFRTYGDYTGPWPLHIPTGTIQVPYHLDMGAMWVVLPYRVLLLPRLVLYHSKIWKKGAALASLANVEVGVGVAIRTGFASKPWSYLFFLIAFPFFSLSFIFSNCERLVEPLYGTHHHAAWASYVSLTTVGYGNDESQTMCGRAASMVLIILGIMGTSLLISQVENNLHMTREQQTVMRLIAEKEKDTAVRVVSAIAIQSIWRKMREYRIRRHGSPKNAPQGKKPEDSKEVLRAIQKLKAVRKAPIDFDQDFTARVESKVWDLNRECAELKDEVKRESEITRGMVLKEMALIQGRMVKTMLEEIRSESAPPRAMAASRGDRPPDAGGGGKNGGKKGGGKSMPKKGGGTGVGNVFSTLAVAKKRAAPIRSRRLSRD